MSAPTVNLCTDCERHHVRIPLGADHELKHIVAFCALMPGAKGPVARAACQGDLFKARDYTRKIGEIL